MFVATANAMPILLRQVMGRRGDWPLDFGIRLRGRQLFGTSKTWRGVLAAVLGAGLLALLLGLQFFSGLLAGGLAMLGDLLASFCKRRLGLAPSSRALLLDQVPESLLPALYFLQQGYLDAWGVVAVVVVFTSLELLVSPLLFWLHIRKRPY